MSNNLKNTAEYYNLSFSTLLNKRALENDQRTAFIYKDKKYSWHDIDKGSSIIGSDLAHLGVKKGTHVGICGLNSINWILTFFAVQKLGGIAVLINPGLKPLEVEDFCKIGDVTHLCYAEISGITAFNVYKDICLNEGHIKSMYNISDSIDFISKTSEMSDYNEHFENNLNSDDACVIIYTSGSTGKPKAVLSSAYSFMCSMTPIIESINHSIDDINLAFLPFFHVFGFISTLIGGLLIGFCSVIPQSKSPKELISLIDKYKVTLFNTVPTMMLGIIADNDFSPEKLSTLRSTILGGSATTKNQMLMFKKLLPNNHFGIIYGMSENAAVSFTDYIDTVEHITETIGKPLNGVQVIIKDNDGNQLNDGCLGEICIKSGGLLVWYYKLPLDKQPIDSDGFLRTGDLGYIDEDGYIRLSGRIKDLIICGGENISPKEIAEALLSLNHFSDVEIVGIPDPIKGEVVAAAVIAKPDYIWNENVVRNELSEILAKYKLPVCYKVFDKFPVLSTGKIDKVSIINSFEKR